MDELVESFEWFADWAEDVSPLYERLCRGVADDEELLDIAAETPDSQPPPNLLLGAVHALLLDGYDHRLALFYHTRTDEPTDPTETNPFPAFREFCLAHEAEIRDIVASRRVQTNAVGRSAVVFPAVGHVLETNASAPLALVEIGASGGLNLFWDRFRYEYGEYGPFGDPGSQVTIESEARGGVPPFPASMPKVGHRIGIDINPLDISDPADAQWLRALIIPDQQWRFQRLDGAIDVASEDPPELVAGDALDVLPEVLAEIPPWFEVCVFSTLVLYQFEGEQIQELRELLREASSERPIHWLSNDPDENLETPHYRYVYFEGSNSEERQLAEYKAHGEWIRWLAE